MMMIPSTYSILKANKVNDLDLAGLLALALFPIRWKLTLLFLDINLV